MFREAIRVLVKPRTSRLADGPLASIAFGVGGLVVFMISTLRILSLHASLQLTEGQLILGLLVSICVMMQMVATGILVDISRRIQTKEGNQR